MRPVLFSIGGLHFYSLGIFIMLGILMAGFIVRYLAGKEKMKVRNVFDSVLYIAVAGMICARFAYFLIYRGEFNQIWQVLYFWQGGLTAYGGLVGGLFFALWYYSYRKENPWKWLDIIALAIMPAWAIALIGYFIGSPVLKFKDVTFNDVILLQIVWLFASNIFLYYVWKQRRFIHGVIFLMAMMSLVMMRFIVDIWSFSEKTLWIMSDNQTVSLAIFVVCLLILARLRDMMQPQLLTRVWTPIARRAKWRRQ